MKAIIGVLFITIIVVTVIRAEDKADACGKDIAAEATGIEGTCYAFEKDMQAKPQPVALGKGLYAGQSLRCEPNGHVTIRFCATGLDIVVRHDPKRGYIVPNVPSENPEAEDGARRALRKASRPAPPQWNIGTPAGRDVTVPTRLATGSDERPSAASDLALDQQSWIAQRAKQEYGLLKQECETLHYSQPQAYEPCLEKAKSTRENLFTQGSEQAGQGSQGSASNQSGQSEQKQGPIDKVASVVKEKLVDWGLASPDQGREGQPSAGQQGQGSQQGSSQARNPLQASFEAGQGTQGQAGQQSFGGGSGQGGQKVGQQGLTQGQQFQGQQGQSGQGSFQGGNYSQQPQGQSWQQGTGGTNQQFQSGGTQGPQGSSSQQGASTSGSAGEEEEHMNSIEYYQELARQQYAILKQECNTLKRDPSVFEQCQQHAKSVRDKIAGMAEQG